MGKETKGKQVTIHLKIGRLLQNNNRDRTNSDTDYYQTKLTKSYPNAKVENM